MKATSRATVRRSLLTGFVRVVAVVLCLQLSGLPPHSYEPPTVVVNVPTPGDETAEVPEATESAPCRTARHAPHVGHVTSPPLLSLAFARLNAHRSPKSAVAVERGRSAPHPRC